MPPLAKEATSNVNAPDYTAKEVKGTQREVVRAWERQRVVAREKGSTGSARRVASPAIQP